MARQSNRLAQRNGMAEPDRTLLVLREIRDEIRSMSARMTFEFSEIHDRLRRLDERIETRLWK